METNYAFSPFMTTASRIAQIKGGTGSSSAEPPASNAFSLAAEQALQAVIASNKQQGELTSNITDLAKKSGDLVATILPQIQALANKQSGIADQQLATGQGVISQGKNLVDQYTNTFAPLQGRVADLAMKGVTANYDGVRGNAAADVNDSYATAKADQLRQMGDAGINPGSGQYESLTRNMGMDQAKTRALAVNNAGNNETNRVQKEGFQMATQGLNSGQGLLNAGAGLESSGAGIMGNAGNSLASTAQAYGSMTNAYAPAINALGTASSAIGANSAANANLFSTTANLGMAQSAAAAQKAAAANARSTYLGSVTRAINASPSSYVGGSEGGINGAMSAYDLANPGY